MNSNSMNFPETLHNKFVAVSNKKLLQLSNDKVAQLQLLNKLFIKGKQLSALYPTEVNVFNICSWDESWKNMIYEGEHYSFGYEYLYPSVILPTEKEKDEVKKFREEIEQEYVVLKEAGEV